MTIRYQRGWTWVDYLIYGAGLAVSAGIAVVASWAMGRAGIHGAEQFGTLAVPLTWAFIAWRSYLNRARLRDSVRFVTSQGVSFTGNPPCYRQEADLAVLEVETWYELAKASPAMASYRRVSLDDVFNGYVVIASATPPADPKHAIVKAKELTYPGLTTAWAVLPHDEFMSVVRHGLAHAALSAAGVPQDDHHRVMRETGFRDA